MNLKTYTAFVDYSKAFDRVSRDLLWKKLEKLGLRGKFLQAVKSLYHNVECSVRLNGVMTDWFNVETGLKQGCLISPLLFSLYLNDFCDDIQNLNLGVPVGEESLSMLLYADDVCLIAETEMDLQRMLDALHSWCIRWKLQVNYQKTQVVHFRCGPSIPRTEYPFKCGPASLSVVEKYRYLGLVFTEFLDFNIMVKAVTQAAHRALGLLIAKDKSHGGMPFSCFSKLFDQLVQPIIDYGAGIWGHKSYATVNSVQYRAARYYLGVGPKTPLAFLYGETGWRQPQHRIWLSVIKQWRRLVNMDSSRLNKRTFLWAQTKRNFLSHITSFMEALNVGHLLTNETGITARDAATQLNPALDRYFQEI